MGDMLCDVRAWALDCRCQFDSSEHLFLFIDMINYMRVLTDYWIFRYREVESTECMSKTFINVVDNGDEELGNIYGKNDTSCI